MSAACELGAPLCTEFILVYNHAPLQVYGPTEASVFVSDFMVKKYNGTGSVPIGKPIRNVKLYVLNPTSLEPCPCGVPGELFISGPCLARGYIGQPEMTAERFMPNPHSVDPAFSRIYHSGDVAAWCPDGNIRCEAAWLALLMHHFMQCPVSACTQYT
jgi:non-ribosomal peptide synthetase component F